MTNKLHSVITNSLGVIREGGWVILAQFILLIGGIVLLSVISKNVTIATYGKYAVLLTAASGVTQVLFGGVNSAAGRYYAIAKKGETVAEYFYAAKYIVFSLAFIVSLIAIPGLVFAKKIGMLSELYPALLILLFALISAFRSNLSRIQNAARLRSKVAIFNACEVSLKIVLVLSIVSAFGGSLVSLISALTAAVVLVTFFQYRSLVRFIGSKLVVNRNLAEVKQQARSMILFARTFVFSFLMIWLNQSSARWALGGFSGAEAVGGFMAVYQLSFAPMALGFAALSSYLAPIMYQRIEEKKLGESGGASRKLVKGAKIGHLTWWAIILVFCSILLAFSALLHERYFLMFVPTEYAIYSSFMGVVLVAGFFTGLGEILALKFLADMRVIAVRNIKLISTSVGLFGNVLGAWFFGVQGVFLSILLSSFVAFFLFFTMLKLTNSPSPS